MGMVSMESKEEYIMSFFTTNYSELNTIKAGQYEVVINEIREDAAKTGTKFLNFFLKVRTDVNQAAKGEMIFQKVYQNKETHQYPPKILLAICQAVGVPENANFNSLQDLMNALTRRPVKVKVDLREFNGQEQPEVKAWSKSDFPQILQVKTQEVKHEQQQRQTNAIPF